MVRVSLVRINLTCLTTVQGPPYKGGGSLDLHFVPSSTHIRSPILALSFQTRTPGCTWTPSGESPSPHGPWSACLQPSPCDLSRDSALAFLVLTGLLSGSMGLPIKYPPISIPRIYLGRSFGGFVRLRGSTPWFDFSDLSHKLKSRLLLALR